VLVHVVDVTHPNAAEQVDTVERTLEELGVDGQPVIVALNKIDRLSEAERERLTETAGRIGVPADAVPISAQRGINLDQLLDRIEATLEVELGFIPVALTVPFDRMELVDRFHQLGRVDVRDSDEAGMSLVGWLPEAELGRFDPFIARREVDAAVEEEATSAELIAATAASADGVAREYVDAKHPAA
jgi:GTP-binding protein HflX